MSDNGWDTGLRDGDYTISAALWWGQNGTTFRLFENGVLIDEQKLTDRSPLPQFASVHVTGRANGTYVYTGELVNAAGTTATTSVTVKVTDANPGKPSVAHDNWDGDGSYTVTGTKWWGTAATEYRLYENDVLVDTQALTGTGPGAQSASTAFTGKAAGTYRYRVELANAAGTTSSNEITVKVKKRS